MSKCVLGIGAQLLKTAGIDGNSPWKNSRKTVWGVASPPPLYARGLILNCKYLRSCRSQKLMFHTELKTEHGVHLADLAEPHFHVQYFVAYLGRREGKLKRPKILLSCEFTVAENCLMDIKENMNLLPRQSEVIP